MAMTKDTSTSLLALLAFVFTFAGCAHVSDPDAALADRPVLLLGEVHDNPQGHRLRTELLARRIAAGWRPAIAMEQFDRERQGALDRAMAQCADAACVIAAAVPAKAGWEWSYYGPVIALALRHRLPVLAANVSRADAANVVRNGFASALDAALIRSFHLDQPLPADLAEGHAQEIETGHCGQLPAALLPGMVQAQVARDVWMAQLVRQHAPRGVVLLAGNGHVRRDLGVPRWLPASLAATSIGYVEDGEPAGAFDLQVRIGRHSRDDPCAGL